MKQRLKTGIQEVFSKLNFYVKFWKKFGEKKYFLENASLKKLELKTLLALNNTFEQDGAFFFPKSKKEYQTICAIHRVAKLKIFFFNFLEIPRIF